MAQSTLPDYANRFFDAINRQDSSAFLDAFTPDGIVDDWGRTYTGRDSIRSWSDKELIGAGGIFTPQRVKNRKNGVITVTGVYRSGHINGLNSFTLQQRDGKLTKVKIRKAWKTPSMWFANNP
ncbi:MULTISPECIES: nuclear transport factor 2 family protein [Tsukamurella]|uniref:nuclear transport factor 2 family protein n=1 Tax=Tsukamurella TaxID=2060 RepID=UPI002DD43A24|nr:nuclear transport factor 2 family protein [Tsukamurella tyrosinosolvens]MEC4616348.1 nuclear transport factor 2 family protein [Tsukamurella tyrosinosolvens]